MNTKFPPVITVSKEELMKTLEHTSLKAKEQLKKAIKFNIESGAI